MVSFIFLSCPAVSYRLNLIFPHIMRNPFAGLTGDEGA